jgi:predicted Zn-dependent peptidase
LPDRLATDVNVVNETLGKTRFEGTPNGTQYSSVRRLSGNETVVDRPESVQSSIRMGRVLFNRHHPDYFKMLVTNEILGGYFGSRLMKNIREEKGLTYGISSHVVTLRNEGYFMIGTDVKKEFTQQTIDEIKKEINKLQTELVGRRIALLLKTLWQENLPVRLTLHLKWPTVRKYCCLTGCLRISSIITLTRSMLPPAKIYA